MERRKDGVKMKYIMIFIIGIMYNILPSYASVRNDCVKDQWPCFSNSDLETNYKSNIRAKNTRVKSVRRIDNKDIGSSYSGMASYYWQPQRVASGGMFNPNALTAAHKTLPFGTRVRVTNRSNGRSVEVVINDRGPFVRGRVIDLSRAAASQIGMVNSGVAPVSISVIR